MTPHQTSQRCGDEITIRRAATVADYRACQDAQRRAWGISRRQLRGPDRHDGRRQPPRRPGARRVSARRRGGRRCRSPSSAGSRAGSASIRSSPASCPATSRPGLGYAIKLAPARVARAEGIARIAWAFDPLQAGNAHFNLTRLGRLGRPLHRQHVRPADRRPERRRPTDRLIAEWETGEGKGVARLPLAMWGIFLVWLKRSRGVDRCPACRCGSMSRGCNHRGCFWRSPTTSSTYVASSRSLRNAGEPRWARRSRPHSRRVIGRSIS